MSVCKNITGLTLLRIFCALFALAVAGTAIAAQQQPAIRPSGPVVLPDGHVTFSLIAPQATQVSLNFQNNIGPSPAADLTPMTKNSDGIWSVTIGPLTPDWYGYGFILDGAKISDPANRNIWSGTASAWSYVLVPGPAADYLAEATVPHGAWGTLRYFSKVAQKERQMQIYTPPGYGQGNQRYPVLYIMHGGGGNDTDWIVCMRANYIMDNLIAQNRAKPMILVMPDSYVVPPSTSGPSTGSIMNSIMADKFPQELLGSVIPTIEQNYRVAPGAENRAMAGLSMGGLRTLNTVFLNPGVFAYVGIFSSGWFNEPVRDDLVKNHLDLLTSPEFNQRTKLLWLTSGGREDITYDATYATLALFDKYKIKHTFIQGTGGHVWGTWRRNLLSFAPLLFR